MAVTKAELGRALQDELERAEGYDGGELSELRKDALESYYGRQRGGKIAGRSAAQSNDVYAMVEAIISQLMPGLSGDSIVEFEPYGANDVQQAQQESDVVNNVVVEANRGYTMFQEVFRDALLLRNGWVKAYKEDETRVEMMTPPADAEPEMVSAMIAAANQQEGIEAERADNGEIKVTRKQTQLRVTSVDPVRMRWSKGHDSVFLEGIPFLAEQFFPTRSELISAGHSKAKVNGAKATTVDTNLDNRRMARGESQDVPEATDASMERLEAFWCLYQYDSDGDGIAEQHRILYLPDSSSPEDRIIEDEIVSFIEYATGTPILQPHQLNGLGVYDALKDVEENKREALRQWLDNLKAVNNARLAVNVDQVTVQDAVNSRPGGVIRVNGPIRDAVLPVQVADVGASAMAAMEYQDKIRSERAGASLDLNTAQMQIAGDTAHGVERQMSSREQMAALMCRTLAETLIRQVYLLVHRGLREWMQEPMSARVRGQFVDSDPAQWPYRDRVNVKSGLSIGERQARRGAMEAVIGQQEKLSQAGYEGVLVNSQGYHAAIQDWARSAMIDSADRYFMDPASPESQKAANDKAAQAKQMQDIQMQMQQQAVTSEQQAQAIESAISKYKADVDASLKYFAEVMGAELEVLKLQQTSPTVEALQVEGIERSGEAGASAVSTGAGGQ